ncbi:MAG TPA: ABC transporter substrate-binding protein, partial [Vicinamibacteria bacterium]|nr:ABC transporter substrate-binding protein [Vicinamibacteria bacterium]
MTALALALALSAASGPETLVVGVLADPVTLVPHRASDIVGSAIVGSVCETLVRYRSDGRRPEATLATTWATVDRRVWTFTLREGVRFQDGAPLDADAVVANLDDLRRERGFPGRARRIGPHVVELTLDQPSAALLATLSQPFFCIESPGRAPGRPPIGTGPFRIVSSGPGRVELERHAGYWGGPPRLKKVVFRRFAGEDALVEALFAGEVDVTNAIGQDRVGRLREHPAVTLDSRTGLNLAFLSVNNESRPLSDVRVRQALSRAIDRDVIVRELLGGHGEPARNPLPPLLAGYDPRAKALHLDRAGARRLLAEAGFPAGFETSLLAVSSPRAYLPSPLRMAARIQADLAQVGIKAALREASSWTEYIGRASRGEYDLCLLGWQADTPDPNDFLSALLSTEALGVTN